MDEASSLSASNFVGTTSRPSHCREPSRDDWLPAFEARNGRKLRVLHVGNIANNAYNNAKIQRQAGIAADVLNFGYYHSMACPEWEDAQHSGSFKDEMFADWWDVDLKGYERPRWFVQGPLDMCIRYLLAWTGKKRSAEFLWRWLTLERWFICRRSWWWQLCHYGIVNFTGGAVHPGSPVNALLMRRIAEILLDLYVPQNAIFHETAIGRELVYWSAYLLRHGRTAAGTNAYPRRIRMRERLGYILTRQVNDMLLSHGRKDRVEDLHSFYQYWFHPHLRTLLERYDIVQFYATYTAIPFIIGYRPYVAYEHGTIRTIPFDETDEGRMCLASYSAAEAVLITNLDNIRAADKIGIARERRVYLPHAFDDRKLIDFARAHPQFEPAPGGHVTFVSPCRQHWVDGHPTWAKGNDRVFAALRKIKDASRHCVLQVVAWGKDVEASKKRIEELGIGDMVVWLPTLPKHELWEAYLRSHAIVDQFVMKGIGGVTFEAMTLGRRVISAIEEPLAAEFFGVTPPIYNCETSEEIAAAMLRVIEDPDDVARDGARCATWIARYHSARRIVDLQVELYRRVLASRPSRRGSDDSLAHRALTQ
jgi:glycosyltransferase involved in cell wall biosynthesis